MSGDLGKDKGGFAIFSTLEAGWNAFITMVEKWQTGASKVYKQLIIYFSGQKNTIHEIQIMQKSWLSI